MMEAFRLPGELLIGVELFETVIVLFLFYCTFCQLLCGKL